MLPPFDIVVSAGYIHANLVPLAFLLIFFYGFYELVVQPMEEARFHSHYAVLFNPPLEIPDQFE